MALDFSGKMVSSFELHLEIMSFEMVHWRKVPIGEKSRRHFFPQPFKKPAKIRSRLSQKMWVDTFRFIFVAAQTNRNFRPESFDNGNSGLSLVRFRKFRKTINFWKSCIPVKLNTILMSKTCCYFSSRDGLGIVQGWWVWSANATSVQCHPWYP